MRLLKLTYLSGFKQSTVNEFDTVLGTIFVLSMWLRGRVPGRASQTSGNAGRH
jgi:hypothetical protein